MLATALIILIIIGLLYFIWAYLLYEIYIMIFLGKDLKRAIDIIKTSKDSTDKINKLYSAKLYNSKMIMIAEKQSRGKNNGKQIQQPTEPARTEPRPEQRDNKPNYVTERFRSIGTEYNWQTGRK